MREGSELFSHALSSNTSLETINLDRNGIKDGGAKWIGEMVASNSTLKDLRIGDNKITEEGVRELAKGLKQNSSIRSLSLARNTIKCKGAKWMANCIEHNSHLTRLDLFQTEIGDDGMAELMVGLIHNYTLRACLLSANPFGKIGGKGLASMLEKNTSLTRLFLNKWGFEEPIQEVVIEKLKHNRSILELYPLPKSKEASAIFNRNLIVWKDRVKWSCCLNAVCRTVLLGKNCTFFPVEMIHEVLAFTIPKGRLKEKEKRNVMKYASDISTIGNDRLVFLEAVFGKGIDLVLEELRHKRMK